MGRVIVRVKAGSAPGCVCSSLQGFMWAFLDSVHCSSLPQQWSKGVLAPPPTYLQCYDERNREPLLLGNYIFTPLGNCVLLCCCSGFTLFLQIGCGSRRGLYTHQASQWRWGCLIIQASKGDHGSKRGRAGYFCSNGPGHAKIPENHPTTGLPQHGEHPHTSTVLYHTQHDSKGKRLWSPQHLT